MYRTLCSLLALTTLATATTQASAYDKNDNHIVQVSVREVLQSTVKINSKVTIEEKVEGSIDPNDSTSVTISASGSGVVLYDEKTKDTYILTCNHVLPPEGINERFDKVESHVYFDGKEAKIIKRDREKDLALLKVRIPFHTPYEGKIAVDFDVGDYTIGSGFPAGNGPFLYYGHVSGSIDKSPYIDSHVNLGESGGPIFVFDKGKAVLFALAQLKIRELEGIGGIVEPKAIAKFLKGTVLEDDYLKK